MLPASTGTPAEFTPEHYKGAVGAPVYLIEVPSRMRRAELNREIESKGAVFHNDTYMRELLRECIREIVPDAEQAVLIEVIDQHEEQLKAGPPYDEKLVKQLVEIEDSIRQHHPRYRETLANNSYYFNLLPLIATQLFLIGRKGEKPFPRQFGKISPEAYERLPDTDVVMIGFYANKLNRLSEEEEKNSESPSR